MRKRTFLRNGNFFWNFADITKIVFFIFLPGFLYVSAFSQSEVYFMRFIEKRNNGFQITLLMRTEKVSGFAKVQENIPETFTAKSGEVSGSVFSFSENKVKFIWQSLPAGLIKISYFISPVNGSSDPTDFFINGNFSYLFNNEKRVYEIEDTKWPMGN